MKEKAAELDELQHLFSQAPIGLCTFDQDLRYLRINQWLARINGLPVAAHLGRTIADVLPEVAAGVELQLRQVLESGEPILNGLVTTTTPAHPTTRRTYMHNYLPTRSADGTVVGVFCAVQDVTAAEQQLEGALAEVGRLKDQLQAENVYLREEIEGALGFEEIVGKSDALARILLRVDQVAATDLTVMILGETGTGKELIARAIHKKSRRRERPLVKVNCSALPATLIESELFGHEKGSFTGAVSRRIGRFELADGGTIFLDEIADLPLELQAKLLRVLQEGELERLGSAETRKVDVRVIAATNRDLEQALAEGAFRSDLYYRLNVFPVELPPLRHRRDDIPLLVWHFVNERQGRLGKRIEEVPARAMETLVAYHWPGNVRELEHIVERALIFSSGRTLAVAESFGANPARTPAPGDRTASPGSAGEAGSLQEVERRHIASVLAGCGWKIKGQGNAAERLGVSPSTLRSKMKKLGIARGRGA